MLIVPTLTVVPLGNVTVAAVPAVVAVSFNVNVETAPLPTDKPDVHVGLEPLNV